MALSMLTPFLWMLGTSLMGELEVYQYPPKFIPEKILWNNSVSYTHLRAHET